MTRQPVIIVTGATSGIGEAAAVELARRGARVGIVARNPRKVDDTLARIEHAAPGTAVDVRTFLIRRPDQGAKVVVTLATDPSFAARTGEVVSSTPGGGLLPHIPALRDAALRRRLWDATESLLASR